MPPALPDLSTLSLEPRDVAPIGKNGDQCDPTKSRDKLKCVRMRLHPRVFEAVRDRINVSKYNADSTSICFLGPLSLRDQRYRTRTIEDTFYKSEQWITLRNKYLYRNEHDQRGAGFFAWASDIRIRPGTYQPGSGWTILPESLRHRTWYDVAASNGNTWQSPPSEEINGYYEPGLFGAELCMVPAWDYVKFPEDTAAFVVALYDYNLDHPAYWIQKVEERMLAAEAQAAAQRERGWWWMPEAQPPQPAPEVPGVPPNSQLEGWLRELEAQGRRAPTPPPNPPLEPRNENDNAQDVMDEVMREIQDDPDAYAGMFS